MTSAVAEMPPAQDTATPDTPSPPETAPEVQATTTKPEGVTVKTWNALSQQGMIFFNARCAGADVLTAYDIAGYDPDGTNATHRRRNARNIERAKRMVKAKLEYEQHREECEAFDKRCDLDWIVAEHRRIMADAHIKGDLAVETRNLELIGKTRGVYVDSAVVDVTARRELTEREQVEARHLARLRLEEMEEVQIEVGTGDHRGASMSNSAPDPAASQGGEMQPGDTASKAASGKVDTRADRTREDEDEQPAGEGGEVVGQARGQVRGARGTGARREGVAPEAAGSGESGAGDGEGVPGMPLTPAAGVGYCGPDTITKPGEEGRA